jgi:hypothetical protein
MLSEVTVALDFMSDTAVHSRWLVWLVPRLATPQIQGHLHCRRHSQTSQLQRHRNDGVCAPVLRSGGICHPADARGTGSAGADRYC